MIRPYGKEDLPSIIDIANRAWKGIFAMYRKTLGEDLFNIMFPDVDNIKGRQLELSSREHPDFILIYESENQIAGFITFYMDKETKIGIIGNNAVDPERGLKGVGQLLYQAVFERFRKEGMLYAKVTTGLDDAHAPARKTYERAGFDIRREDITYFMNLGKVVRKADSP